ncbi:ATP-binding cassette domain-containing protein, partial [Paracraurococcus ruber]
AVGGDLRGGGQALADLQALRAFLAGPGAAAPLDLALGPLLLALLFLLHPALGWYGLAAACALLALALLTDGAARPRLAQAQERMERAIGGTAGLLRDETVRDGLGMGPAIAARWRAGQGAALDAMATASCRGEGWAGAARLLRGLLQAGAVTLAALLVLRHEATPGAVLGANLLLAMLLAPLDSVLAQWRAVAGARLAWDRVAAALARTEAGPPPQGAAPGGMDPSPGLMLEAIAIHPPGRQQAVLAGLSLSVAPGEMVLLTGPNGSGKSSLLRIAAGVLPPASGRAFAAGLAAPAAAWAGRIGWLPQRPQVMEGTVAETIARFGPATPEALVAAARAAGLHEAIGRLPRGYATAIGPLSRAFSGGEMQRLALARALFGDPPVLVLDEPDAGLDHAGEQVLAAALQAARARGAAILAVSHRAGLRGIADRVVELPPAGDQGPRDRSACGAAPGEGTDAG